VAVGVSCARSLFAIIDIKRFKVWAFPLVVIGMNSIAAYVMAHLFEGFIAKALKTFRAKHIQMFGAAYEPFCMGGDLLVLWCCCFGCIGANSFCEFDGVRHSGPQRVDFN
jgi:predicted acyltransferase